MSLLPSYSLFAWQAAAISSINGWQHFNSRIAFIQANASTPGGDVYTMNPDGSDVRQLTNLGPNNSAFWENWSFDGRQIVFVESPNSPGQLWLMRADGSGQHLLLSEADYGEYAPSFSPDGVWVVFTRCQNVSNGNGCAIYRIRTDGSGLTPVTDFQLALNDWEPVYSPDGMTIAFDSFNRDGFVVAIWLMNADGSDIRRITPPELECINPHWSPDGEKIAFRTHGYNPQNNDIWVINRDGNGLHRLTGTPSSDLDIPVAYYNEAPSWSPHGHAITFDQYDPKTNTVTIFVINADGSRRTQLMKFSAARPRIAGQASMSDQHRKRRHYGPREVEENGVWPRWSPELQNNF
jgi:TolB protein